MSLAHTECAADRLMPRPGSTASPDRLAIIGRPVTADEWLNQWATRDESWELVDGIPLMVPPEHPHNTDATSLTMFHLYDVFGKGIWHFLPQPGVRIVGGPSPTYRIPDLVVCRRGAPLTNPLDPAPVVLVVEALSPATRAEDLGPKRRDYASAGIPNYLILDRHATPPAITLLTDPADDDYRTEVTGDTVTLHIDGHDITLRADDLFL